MFKLDLEKAEEPEIKLPTSAGPLKKREFQKNIYFCFIDYAKAFDCVDHNKLWKILKEMGIPEVAINPTIETQELTQDWEIDSRRIQQNLVHQDPEERSRDLARN